MHVVARVVKVVDGRNALFDAVGAHVDQFADVARHQTEPDAYFALRVEVEQVAIHELGGEGRFGAGVVAVKFKYLPDTAG